MQVREYKDAAHLFTRADCIPEACEAHGRIGTKQHDFIAADLWLKINKYKEAATLYLKHKEVHKCFQIVKQQRESIALADMAFMGSQFQRVNACSSAAQCFEWAKRYDDAAREYAKTGNNSNDVGRMLWQAKKFENAVQAWLSAGIEVFYFVVE